MWSTDQWLQKNRAKRELEGAYADHHINCNFVHYTNRRRGLRIRFYLATDKRIYCSGNRNSDPRLGCVNQVGLCPQIELQYQVALLDSKYLCDIGTGRLCRPLASVVAVLNRNALAWSHPRIPDEADAARPCGSGGRGASDPISSSMPLLKFTQRLEHRGEGEPLELKSRPNVQSFRRHIPWLWWPASPIDLTIKFSEKKDRATDVTVLAGWQIWSGQWPMRVSPWLCVTGHRGNQLLPLPIVSTFVQNSQHLSQCD